MNMSRLFFLVAIFLLSHQVATLAQTTSIYDEPGYSFREALELFNKEKYGAAKALFRQIVEHDQKQDDAITAEATFYLGVSAAELFNPDAGKWLLRFIDTYPTHPAQPIARFHMGNVSYRNRNYEEAAKWFASASTHQFTAQQRNEYHFKLGYSLFMTNQYQAARQSLAQVKDPASSYFAPANYYYGHIAYLEGEYDLALSIFNRLKDDNNFGPVIPYYITYIYFLQGMYDELLAYAPALLEEASPRRAPEISKMIGEAYFNRSRFEEAIPYLRRFIDASPSQVTAGDYYQLGFAYFSMKDHANAIIYLERATKTSDELAQNAWYHLASSYIETQQKRFARNAFLQAYQLGFSREIAQESLFNYALLSFELSLDPYNEAILSFQRYIEEYPDSERISLAQTYLIDLYLTTSNFKDALASIERMNINTPRLREAHQRIAYYRGVELFNNGNFTDAVAHFVKARRFSENRSITALSLFWEGEAHYRLGDYARSAQTHEQFLTSPGAFLLDIYNRAHYSIGYGHFKMGNHGAAITAFRKFIAERNEDQRLRNDALLRIADSYFISKNYPAALDFYDRAIRIGVLDNDYAVFQKSLVYGIMGQFENKITTLQQFLANYGMSTYASDARYEMANTWLLLNNSNQAMNYFNQVITRHPNSSNVKSAMLKIGLIHFNNNEDERALQVFKQVVDKYPGTPESQEALGIIRNIYVAMNQVDAFFAYSENLGFANVTTAQQDSLTYVAAENRYMQGDCENAIRGFSNYIERFPSGIFSLNAHFYRAECEFRRNNHDQALSGYAYVISRPKSKFTENALSRASQIEFSRGQYEQAYQHFSQLADAAEFRSNVIEARRGQMRSLYRLHRFEEAIRAANTLLDIDKIPPEFLQEAYLILGKSYLETQNLDQAAAALTKAAEKTNNEMAAEALYFTAWIEFRKGNYEKSETMIFDFVNRISAYDYWLARSFLLLADNYIEMDNAFQARHTLESIIENYQGDDLRQEARQRLQYLDEVETQDNTRRNPDPGEVDFD